MVKFDKSLNDTICILLSYFSFMKPYLIGISGGSGSGKTTFVRTLMERFDSKMLSVHSQDNYYLDRDFQNTDENNVKNFDLPESFKREDYYKDLLKLIDGEDLKIREYVYNNDKAELRDIDILSAKVILVEGLFIYHFTEIHELLDLKLYVDAKDVFKIIRRISRDKKERNYPVEDVIYRYKNHVLPSYEKYLAPFKSEVDLIINNHQNFDTAIEIVENHIKSKLQV